MLARKLGSHNKVDCTEIDWTEATEEKLCFDVRQRSFPMVDAQGILIQIWQRRRRRRERMYMGDKKLLCETSGGACGLHAPWQCGVHAWWRRVAKVMGWGCAWAKMKVDG